MSLPPIQIDRFAPNARTAINQAPGIARLYGYRVLTVEHLLLAVFEQSDADVEQLLSVLALGSHSVRLCLHDILSESDHEPVQIEQLRVSDTLAGIVGLAETMAQQSAVPQIQLKHILYAALSRPDLRATQALNQMGITLERANQVWLQGVEYSTEITEQPALFQQASTQEMGAVAKQLWGAQIDSDIVPIEVSPVFVAILLIAIGGGLNLYFGRFRSLQDIGFNVFIFVVAGWLVSLSFHEFGHALVAYAGGDKSMDNKGYLTLNPFKYTHPILSIALPFLIILQGGIGLPGGAVFVNFAAIPKRDMRSLTAAGGPIATAVLTVFALLPFAANLADLEEHVAFWAGFALLTFFNLTTLLFNLLPFPGLDGFGIIAPFLPDSMSRAANFLGRFTFFAIFFLFFQDTPVSQLFWAVIWFIIARVGLEPQLIGGGYEVFRFWTQH